MESRPCQITVPSQVLPAVDLELEALVLARQRWKMVVVNT